MGADTWTRVGSVAEVRRQKRVVVPGPAGDVVVIWHDDQPYALANICVHRERELSKGTVFQDRIICPGHQWAFDLATGHCPERDRTQPVYAVRIEGDDVLVDTSAPTNAPDAPAGG